jgi:hypothetical protein
VVEIYVRNKVNFKGRFTNLAGRSSAHVLGYFGTDTVAIQGVHGFRGTLVAPYATIDLNSRAHVGAFYGKKVVVHQGAWVTRLSCADSL